MKGGIRRAIAADGIAVKTIVAEAYAHYVPRIGKMPAPMLEDYDDLIRRDVAYVLESDGKVQGVVVLRPERDTMFLANLAVSPDAQGKGYGRQLLNFAEDAARAANLKSVSLYTNEAMTENIALYGRLSYVEKARSMEDGFRRVFFQKPL